MKFKNVIKTNILNQKKQGITFLVTFSFVATGFPCKLRFLSLVSDLSTYSCNTRWRYMVKCSRQR